MVTKKIFLFFFSKFYDMKFHEALFLIFMQYNEMTYCMWKNM